MGRTYEALEWAEKETQGTSQRGNADFLVEGRSEVIPAALVSPFGEQYEDLKTNLLTRYPDGSIKTILITGTNSGEGTSTTAINLAAALARDANLKVLLIDVNLRRPGLHGILQVVNRHGVLDLFAGNGCGVSPTRVGPGNLDIIPCGGKHGDPATLFKSDTFDRFLSVARDRYDYVILDGPPVQGFSECRILCPKVDGVVLVIASGKTRREVALSAKRQLEDAGGKILGVVLNRRKFYIPGFIYRWL